MARRPIGADDPNPEPAITMRFLAIVALLLVGFVAASAYRQRPAKVAQPVAAFQDSAQDVATERARPNADSVRAAAMKRTAEVVAAHAARRAAVEGSPPPASTVPASDARVNTIAQPKRTVVHRELGPTNRAP